MDLFEETRINKVPFEKKKSKERVINKHEPIQKEEKEIHKKSVNISPPKCYKRYGTKKPVKKLDMHEVLASWREDI